MIWVLHNTKIFRIFAPEYDNDTAYRIADSAAGHNARLSLRVLYEGRNVGSATEVIVGLRIRRDGFVLMMVLDVVMG